MGLAEICLQMAMQPEDNQLVLLSGGNHWHFADWNGNAEPGSDDFIIYRLPTVFRRTLPLDIGILEINKHSDRHDRDSSKPDPGRHGLETNS